MSEERKRKICHFLSAGDQQEVNLFSSAQVFSSRSASLDQLITVNLKQQQASPDVRGSCYDFVKSFDSRAAVSSDEECVVRALMRNVYFHIERAGYSWSINDDWYLLACGDVLAPKKRANKSASSAR